MECFVAQIAHNNISIYNIDTLNWSLCQMTPAYKPHLS